MADDFKYKVQGFAIVTNGGGINIRSVSPTALAAKVNWLVTDAKIMVYAWSSDETINTMFEETAKYWEDPPRVVQVQVGAND